ncbi:thiamine pyrophosphate-binding protein [Brevibacterium sp. RIT 803]|uniref:thiamine pyrophosphate-binding protein n=1 Tax=Brevibacterium sp. RIT 803 TaxID=2810210 RepID=UPI001951EEFC|nr:thiamine pyrophosphate-binding protein [Brevibacterium sp. RIT 803]MBM6592221.1 thiamine pyrophosphate-binding protein [Brevibacterium sp. RIT 803]
MSSLTYAQAAAQGIWNSQVDEIGYIPSVTVAPVIDHLVELDGGNNGRSSHVNPLSREEEAVGVIGALPLAGKFGAVVMQDNGFGNNITALTTFSISYHLPMLIFANTRGSLGEYNSMIHSVSQPAPDLLRRLGLPVIELDRRSSAQDWEDTVSEAGNHAKMTYRPVIVLGSFWNTDGKVA